MIFIKKYHWEQLVHVEADNYFNLIASIDAKIAQQNDLENPASQFFSFSILLQMNYMTIFL